MPPGQFELKRPGVVMASELAGGSKSWGLGFGIFRSEFCRLIGTECCYVLRIQ